MYILHIQSSVFTRCIVCRHCAASVPVVTVLDGVTDRAPLVGGGEATLVGIWSCVAVLVEEVGRVPLVGGGEAISVGVWPCVAVLVEEVGRVPLVGGGEAISVGVWPCVAVLVEEVGRVPLVGGGEAISVGVWPCVAVVVSVVDEVVDGVPLVVVGSGVAVAVGLPVGSTVLVLMVIPLDPVKLCKHVSICGGHFAICRSYCKCCALSLCHYVPVVSVLVEELDRVPLVGGGEAMLVGVWLCIAVLVGAVGGVPLVGGGDVAASEGVGLFVGSTTLVLLAVLSPVGEHK